MGLGDERIKMMLDDQHDKLKAGEWTYLDRIFKVVIEIEIDETDGHQCGQIVLHFEVNLI